MGSTGPGQVNCATQVNDVLRIGSYGIGPLTTLLQPQGLQLCHVALPEAIPGSHWGAEEAGLIANRLYYRADTPVHSAMHEAGHWLLMDAGRRQQLHTDAGGTLLEECAVCYLQICLAECLPGIGYAQMMHDMDRWGYSFRLGSTAAWFAADAEDARTFLLQRADLPCSWLQLIEDSRAWALPAR